ncbi:uncharacterized protein LOC143034948 [Oratosquilla oratoria]|uniref:uncharacterized protein LOC143034948 n=1 Tax=Oratosquilla oratoria TaxID=337810 RepID=UPI003F764E28
MTPKTAAPQSETTKIEGAWVCVTAWKRRKSPIRQHKQIQRKGWPGSTNTGSYRHDNWRDRIRALLLSIIRQLGFCQANAREVYPAEEKMMQEATTCEVISAFTLHASFEQRSHVRQPHWSV